MTCLELVRHYFPQASDAELDDVIWACTGFPGSWLDKDGRTPVGCFNTQLSRISRRSGGNVQRAMHLSDHILDNVMRRLKRVEE